jgi:hypothetical protein
LGSVYCSGDWQNRVGRNGPESHRGKGVQVYKKGEDQPTSGFQKGDEVRKEAPVQEFYSFYPGE